MNCKECGCTTGGGDYCFEHSPRTIWPLKDGSWYEDKNGQRTHYFPSRSAATDSWLAMNPDCVLYGPKLPRK